MDDAEVLNEAATRLSGHARQAEPDAAGRGLFIPFVRTDRLSAAVVDRNGKALWANGLFADQPFTVADAWDTWELERNASRQETAVFDWTDPSGLDMPMAFGRAAEARSWALPEAARQALEQAGAWGVLLTAGAWRAEGALQETCAAYGATPAQARLVAALVQTGDVPAAAAMSGLTYATARKVIATTMARMGARKHTALISRVVGHTFGVLPSGDRAADVLEDLWGLSPRQAALALAVAGGASRIEAARSAGVSDASAKLELQNIFLSTGAASAGALSRKVADAMSLAALVQATRGDVAASPDTREPLAFAVRPDGGAVAFSDYGPKSGRPVLIVHTGFSSRPAPVRLVEALQAAGWRPLAIDRPGYGLSDVAPASVDHFDQAVEDFEAVCGRLKIQGLDVIARGGFRFVQRLAATRPDRVGRIVLAAVPPTGRRSRSRSTFYHLVQAISAANPHLIRDLAKLCARLFPISDIRQRVIEAVRASPPDVAAIEDPRNFADYWRGLRMFCTGRVEGFVREQSALVAGGEDPVVERSDDWRVLIGAVDTMYDPDETEAHWRRILPRAAFERIEGAGRFPVFTHPERIVAALN